MNGKWKNSPETENQNQSLDKVDLDNILEQYGGSKYFLLIKTYNGTLLSDQVPLGWLFILLLRALRKFFLLIKIFMKRLLSYLEMHRIPHFFFSDKTGTKHIKTNFHEFI